MSMFSGLAEIRDTVHLNAFYFVHTVNLGDLAQQIKPGQFFELKPSIPSQHRLRKPFSVYGVQSPEISFMIRKTGPATEQFSLLKPGDRLDIIGPLGNSFPIEPGKQALLVSGGIGYPPLSLLKKELLKAGNQVWWMHGGRTKDDIFPADAIWTDDGSAGQTGFVTDGLLDYLQSHNPDVVYACGPKPMLKTCAGIAFEHRIPLFVSLEEYMACGIGVCHGCAVKVKSDNSIGVDCKTVCKDGPVFNADEIIWE